MIQLSLRGAGDSFLDACERVLGVRPPVVPNTVASQGERSILWLGPDEWLLIGESNSDIAARLRSELQGIHSAVVDVSASRKMLTASLEALEKAATLDFSLAAFPVGSCAQSNIARTQGILQRKSAQEFVILVRASFEPYLRAWLEDARTE
jgi:sarcosine oxidase subunit gamma